MLLCHCHLVTDGDVELAVEAGARRVGDVVRATRAGTSCGGCLPSVKRACESALARRACPAHGSAPATTPADFSATLSGAVATATR